MEKNKIEAVVTVRVNYKGGASTDSLQVSNAVELAILVGGVLYELADSLRPEGRVASVEVKVGGKAYRLALVSREGNLVNFLTGEHIEDFLPELSNGLSGLFA